MKSHVKALVLALLAWSGAALIADDIHPAVPSDLAVHEWGTFTSVAGPDGSAIEWNVLGCKDDLPGFVYDYGYRGFKVGLSGTVRLETPVIYFYSASELEARVKVEFPGGVITEWYPRAEYPIPVFQRSRIDGSARRLDASLNGMDMSLRNKTGAIEWRNVKIQPYTSLALPVENGPSRYYAARGTDAAPLSVDGQNEKFLFYRGVGRFQVPLSATLSADNKVSTENRGHDPVPFVILFENRGGRIGYRNAGAVEQAVALDPPALDGSFEPLRYDLETALVAQGLFPKEAHAMVETWRDSWFEEGSRLIYIVPSPAIDTILPLQVEPAPSQTARIFVGRIELITSETKRAVEQAIAKGDRSIIDRYGRFLDPILKRISSENPSKQIQIEQFRRSIQVPLGPGQCR